MLGKPVNWTFLLWVWVIAVIAAYLFQFRDFIGPLTAKVLGG